MLAVLADDFTGAAEVAAIGKRYGLTSEVHTTFQANSRADLVVIDTHTRSSSREEAGQRVRIELTRLRDAGVDCIYYKKVDSVLRGHVAAELTNLLDVWGLDRALLVPFNPSFGQQIRAGHYSIRGKPLHETRFAHDPEYPALTADVLELLGPEVGVPVCYRDDASDLPHKGIIITGGVGRNDLLALADQLDGHTLAAGAAEFFDAILQRRLGPRTAAHANEVSQTDAPTMLILGSRSHTSRQTVELARSNDVPVCPMPNELYSDGDHCNATECWADDAVRALREAGHVVLCAGEASGNGDVPQPFPVDLLPIRFAQVAQKTLERWDGPLRLCVSGGTTASTIVRTLEWRALVVEGELEPGVVTLHAVDAPGLSLTVKPGSYIWPHAIGKHFEVKGSL